MTVTVVDLFCGAGGFSTGAALALEDLGHDPGEDVELHAINHWGLAVETHEANHPWAEHYLSDVDDVDPLGIADPGEVDLLVGGPECTHFSTARGGKPVDDQKREPAFNVLTWIQKLRPENVLIENVAEFEKWGSIDDDGQPTKDGEVFDIWLKALNALGYATDHDVLTCADFGDPTSRERLFVVARRDASPTFPEPTHSSDPADDMPDWRPASDIIDWSDTGSSLWTRDLENPRVQPLKYTTMRRIAEGLRRHCDDRLAPFADALDWIGRVSDRDVRERGVQRDAFLSVEELREFVVPVEHAGLVAESVDRPFLVAAPSREQDSAPYLLGQHTSNPPRQVDRPIPTVSTIPRIGLSSPVAFCLRQQSGGVPATTTAPLPTVSGAGSIGLTSVYERPLVMPKNYPQRGLHSNGLYPPEDRPHHTVTTDPRSKLVTPGLIRYSHGGAYLGVDEPMPTIATEKGGVFALTSPFIDDFEGPSKPLSQPLGSLESRERFALVVPEAYPYGLDIRYRMLKPSELKQAQGFPADYYLAGGREKDLTEQIGNAVPVNTAKALCKHLLDVDEPSLSTYGGGLQGDPDAEIPTYEEVVQADD